MKSSYLLAGLAGLVMIGGQSLTASAAQAQEYSGNSGVSAQHQMTRSELRREHAEDFFATTGRPAMPSNPGNLGFIGSSEAGN